MAWQLNFDPGRVPETLVEAQCVQCPLCRDMDSQDLGVGCGPVTYHTKVLRRKSTCDSVTGHYVYVQVRGLGAGWVGGWLDGWVGGWMIV